MTNYWIEKTGIFPEDVSKHDDNYNALIQNLTPNKFGKFLTETGISQNDSIGFLIETLKYVNDNRDEFLA
jgi:hypothetical protein